jgi:hypothetical protein
MHFIEQLFGSAPDNGDGSLELLLLMVPFVVALWKMKRKTVLDQLGWAQSSDHEICRREGELT